MKITRHFSALFGMSVLGMTLSGCSTAKPPPDIKTADARAFATPTGLTAKLVDPIDIDLKWKDHANAEAGYFVEYTPNLNDEFIIILALPPNATYYRHPHLLPQTKFRFRVRPYFGPASDAVEIKTGKGGDQQEPGPELLRDTGPSENEKSLRTTATMAQAAPTDLKATVIPPAGVYLTWKNHASDADGYLLEIKAEWSSEYKVSSFLKPGSTSLTTYNFPLDSKFKIRIRPFFYGQPSNLAEQTTGIDPTLGSGPWIRSDQTPTH